MAKNYSYPRVTMSTLAKKHSHNIVNVPDTTIMFAPLVTEKGPDDRVVKVHTLSEFIEIFGSFNEEFYDLNGQMALNVYNWLSNGGTLMVKRITGGATKATAIFATTTNTGSLKFIPETTSKSRIVDNMLLINIDTNKYIIVDISTTTTAYTEGEVGSGDAVKKIPYYNFSSNYDFVGIDTDYEANYAFIKVDKDGYALIDKTVYSFSQMASANTEEYYKNINEIGTGFSLNGSRVKLDSDVTTINNSDKVILFRISEIAGGTGTIKLEAKYAGEYYNSIQLVAEQINSGTDENDRYFNFYVQTVDEFSKVITLEKFLQKNKKTYAAAMSSSEYIRDVNGTLSEIFECPSYTEDVIVKTIKEKKTYTLKLDVSRYNTSGTVTATSTAASNKIKYFNQIEAARKVTNSDISEYTLTAIENYWIHNAELDLNNRLETPIDIIFDAGYSAAIKKRVLDFVRNDSDEAIRSDIVYIMDSREHTGLRLSMPADSMAHLDNTMWTGSEKPTNVAIYEQFFTILDSTFTSQQIYVMPSYFLSKLFIYNDLTYGIQYPTAGLRRGILDDALWVDKNPSPDQKETWFQKRVNYVEKSAREYAFMSQRTFDGSSDMDYTALSFLNNERVLEKMKKDLETIGRSYLHEFNDAVTIANMSNALNKYVSNWISNRTLSMGVVEVVQDEVSENALDINLNIRFTNTIEVINVSIVIE